MKKNKTTGRSINPEDTLQAAIKISLKNKCATLAELEVIAQSFFEVKDELIALRLKNVESLKTPRC